MNQVLVRPDLRMKSPRLTECSSRWSRSASKRCRAAVPSPVPRTGSVRPGPRRARPHRPGRPPPARVRRRPVRRGRHRRRPAPTTSTMPSPRLNTRAISSSVDLAEAPDLAEDRAAPPSSPARPRRRVPSGRARGMLPGEAATGDVGRGVHVGGADGGAARPACRSPRAAAARRPATWPPPSQAGPSSARPGPLEQDVAGQGVAVAPQARRRQTDQHVARPDPGRARGCAPGRRRRRRTRPGRTRRAA